MAIQLIIDWISVTSHNVYPLQSYATHPVLHDWENWKLCSGKNGYNEGCKHESGVSVYKNSQRPDMGYHMIYSGKTLGRIKKMYDVDAIEILAHHIDSGHNITRIDVAIDFLNTGVNVQHFVNAWDNGLVETRLRSASIVKSLTDDGYTFYVGSRKKRKKLVRIYNKGIESGTGLDWVRVELQLMGKPATQLSILMVRDPSIQNAILQAVKDVIHFPSVMVWRDAFSDTQRLKLVSESDRCGDTRKWLEKQVHPCLKREITLDVEWWIQFKMSLESKIGGM